MVHRLLCERSDLFAAGVSRAGVSWVDSSRCNPQENVSVLQIHSRRDEVISFNGGVSFGPHPGVLETLQDWANKLGVGGALEEVVDLRLDIDSDVEGAEARVLRYPTDSGIDIELWEMEKGVHRMQPTPEMSHLILDWLFAHPKPQ